ncbi:MAG: amino acid permease [Saprospiraceae bacterium]|nr:amino acid permease [Saprospiraceae bacterium]
MGFSDLFRTKSIQKILHEYKENPALSEGGTGLDKQLTVRDLTALGIAAIIGAGIFSTIGTASANGGPAVIFLFVFTAIACGFAAFAYAEFASLLPVSGSAYTYSYVAFGELIAWVIGWALIMEYAVGNIAVAVSWSGYFTSLLENLKIDALGINGIHIADWMTTDFTSAKLHFKEATNALAAGSNLTDLPSSVIEGYQAWMNAPKIGGLRLIADLPAIFITIIITWLVYRGISESRNASNIMVAIKLGVVLLVIIVGAFHIDVTNWHPFVPNGMGGVLAGVSSVFFAYIGFDAISTTAEECKDPQRDLPRGMLYSIIICTVLYITIALVLTGMVNYKLLDVNDPLAFVFQKINMPWLSGIIALSAIVAMASVLLVFQLGQPRIWMSMSRDGLLPKAFSKIHPRYQTPSFATIMTGFMVIVPMLFITSDMIVDLCSMGTLFAFVLVCAGVLRLQLQPDAPRGKFRTPYINSKYIFPLMVIGAIALLLTKYKTDTFNFIKNEREAYSAIDFLAKLNDADKQTLTTFIQSNDSGSFNNAKQDLPTYLNGLTEESFQQILTGVNIDDSKKYESGWQLFQHKIPMWLFVITCVLLGVLCFNYSLSLIPVLGLVSCLYMMAQIPAKSWFGFLIWLLIGLIIYFGFSYKNSKLNTAK